MRLGKWNLTRRSDGDYSLYESVFVPGEDASTVETVERGRFSFQVFWLGIAFAGKALGWLMKATSGPGKKKKRRR
ncbi:MAG: hypothetical protein MJ077_09165 [Oscillospiraceae bacterium]|nr:hypothetical protein [Oscillospiraceae bacterium]